MTTRAVSGVMSWTNDTNGNIWRNTGFITYFSLLRSPPGTQGSTIIGSMISQTDLVYNSTAGIGVATITTNMTFSETNSTKNPYGIGTLQGKATNVKVTEMFPPANPGIGNATGTLIATSGTGNFTNAMLLIDFIMVPFPSAATGPTEAMFLGTHSRVNGRGILTVEHFTIDGFHFKVKRSSYTWISSILQRHSSRRQTTLHLPMVHRDKSSNHRNRNQQQPP